MSHRAFSMKPTAEGYFFRGGCFKLLDVYPVTPSLLSYFPPVIL